MAPRRRTLAPAALLGLFALVLPLIAPPLHATPPGLALAPLERGGGVRRAEAEALQGALEQAFGRQSGVALIERRRLEDVLKEARLQQSGVTRRQDAVRLGHLLNADFFVFGGVGRADGRYSLDLRLVEIESGRVLRAEEAGWDGTPGRGRAVAALLARRLAAAAALLGGQPMHRFAGGQARIGSDQGPPDQRPAHTVQLAPYELDRFETSALAFHAFLESQGETPPFPKDPGSPATGMSWHQAAAYCAAQGKRLPTEAEWEAAARATPRRPGPAAHKPRPVVDPGAAKGPVHLHGNAAEWVQDWWDPAYYAASPADAPPGPERGDYKVYRGASWEEPELGPARRNFHNPERGAHHIGVRCARNAVTD